MNFSCEKAGGEGKESSTEDEAEEEEEVNFDYCFNKTAFFGVFSIYSRVQKST